MTDFLLELRSEEIPARMQDRAREDLARLFGGELAKAGLAAGELVTYATPRRLALIARGLPDETAAVSEEIKGPRSSAPPQALEGFLRKTGLTREQLVERDGVLFAVIDKPGRATADVLAEAIPAIVRGFPWPKSMRWGDASLSTESLRWVRPLHGIVALFGEAIVPCEVAGIASGAATVGHRFHHPGAITIGSAGDYVEKLRACHVIVDQAERRGIIALGAKMAAHKAGLALIEDEALLTENAGLIEWPVPLLGRFDPAFLEVPPEVVQLTARVNQKYFVCRDGEGRLANAFVCVANIDAVDGGARIVAGNEKVLVARLSDARFFYEQDLKVPLAEQAKKLDRIVFHEKLGTVADKVERVAKLARWLVEEGIVGPAPSPLWGEGRGEGERGEASRPPSASDPLTQPSPRRGEGNRAELADMAERAARLAKADLVTGMVGEFPELQGVMGGYYARAQGEPDEVADAIRDHYKPVGQGDEVPTAPVTVAVSLADKLDTLAQFWTIIEPPTGSKDPYALRRAGLSAISILCRSGLRVSLTKALVPLIVERATERVHSIQNFSNWLWNSYLSEEEKCDENQEAMWENVWRFRAVTQFADVTAENLVGFLSERLKVQRREAGVRHDLIDAVFALGGEDDLVRLLARVRALQSFVGTEDGANLLAGYKRAANILKKEGFEPSPLQGRGLGEGALGAAERTDAGVGHPHPTLSLEGEGYQPEPAEAALIAALDAAEPVVADAIAREDFEGAMAALASLRAPIDAFFDAVTVNDPDPAKRAARLALLARVRDAVHRVADFSKIEG